MDLPFFYLGFCSLHIIFPRESLFSCKEFGQTLDVERVRVEGITLQLLSSIILELIFHFVLFVLDSLVLVEWSRR